MRAVVRLNPQSMVVSFDIVTVTRWQWWRRCMVAAFYLATNGPSFVVCDAIQASGSSKAIAIG